MKKYVLPLVCALYFLTIKSYALDCNDEGAYSVATVEDLRAAVNCGNTDGLDTQINLAANVYDLSGGHIEITGQVSIIGASQETTILDAMGANRHFYVSGSAAHLALENLTLQKGYVVSALGGAIYITSSATVNLNNSTLSENTASTGYGGAMYIRESTVSLNNSTLSGNTASYGGGAISTDDATATINNSTFSKNTAKYEHGGAIHIGESTVSLNNSTLSENTAYDGEGGAMYINYSTASLDNSTFSKNTASYGGAIIIRSSAVSLDNSTLDRNTASYEGGAILAYHYDATATINNSTLSGNIAFGPGDSVSSSAYSAIGLRNNILDGVQNCYIYDSTSTIISYGYNLATDDSCNLTSEGDQENVNPMLDVLADNGGPTLTHALLEGSPAIDMGACTDTEGNNVTTDQRGIARLDEAGNPIQDGDGDGMAACDIGSYEVENTVESPEDLIQNGEANEDFNGWNINYSTEAIGADETDPYFQVLTGYIYQDVDLSSYSNQIATGATLTLNALLKAASSSAGQGFPYLYVYFMSDSSTIVGRLFSAPVTSTSWTQQSISSVIPTGTTQLRVFLKLSSIKNATTTTAGYFDSITASIE